MKLKSHQISILAHAVGFTLWRAEVRQMHEAASPGWLDHLDYIQPGDGIIVTGPGGQIALMGVNDNRQMVPAVSIITLGNRRENLPEPGIDRFPGPFVACA